MPIDLGRRTVEERNRLDLIPSFPVSARSFLAPNAKQPRRPRSRPDHIVTVLQQGGDHPTPNRGIPVETAGGVHGPSPIAIETNEPAVRPDPEIAAAIFEQRPDVAPFDGILVTAAPRAVPEALLEQLAVGGRLVVPVGGDSDQALMVYDRTENGIVSEKVEQVRFVPLVKGVG